MDTVDDTGFGSRIVEGAIEENRIKPVITVKQQSHKFIQVKGDGSFVPAYEDEVTQDKKLSAEKQTDTTSVDEAMYFHMDVTDGYFGIGDIPWEIDNYIGKVDCNVLDSTNANGGNQEVEHKYVDCAFGGAAADGGTRHLIPDRFDNVLGSASPGSSQPNCPSYCGSQMENLSSKCKNQSLGKSSNPVKVLDFTVPESTSDPKTMFLKDMSTPELHKAFDSAFGWDTCLKNEEWLRHCILFGLDDFTENDSVLGLIERELPVMENENSKVLIPGNDLAKTVHFSWMNTPEKGSPVLQSSRHARGPGEKTVVGGGDRLKLEPMRENNVVCGKRTQNLPQRYIEEKSEIDQQSHWRGPEVLSIINQVVVAEVPRGRRVQRVCPNKNLRFIMNDFKANNTQVLSTDSTSTSTSRSGPCDDSTYYASLDGSSDDSVEIFRKAKIRSKRKNHRQWTLDEITQLVDGVSQYGVGKWTYIKRFSFSTSYRTSVDLKDKWRNLLKASGVQMKGSKVKPQKKQECSYT